MLIDTSNRKRHEVSLPIPDQLNFARIRSTESTTTNPLQIGIDMVESSKCDSENEESMIKRSRWIMPCGHRSYGVLGEDRDNFMPCLHERCQKPGSRLPTGGELCSICYTSELESEACV